VVPLIKDRELIGVLDLDSASFARFDDEDAEGLNELVKIFMESLRKANC
jgi:GAF domain-containing protein